MGLDVRIKKRLKDFELNVAFSCMDGRLLAIVGPSGAGKTTIIRTLAGLQKPDQGLITCKEEIWASTERQDPCACQEEGDRVCISGIHPVSSYECL